MNCKYCGQVARPTKTYVDIYKSCLLKKWAKKKSLLIT